MVAGRNRKLKIHNGLFYRLGILLLTITLSASVFGQNVIVKGKITDQNTGEAIMGAKVLVKGEKNGTITKIDGTFQISVSSTKAKLICSFMGYGTEEISLNGKTEIEIQLVEDSKIMDEVIVIGYGTSRKGDIAGAISSLNGKAIKDIPIATAAEALTGRIAGVNVTTADGSPDAEVTIRVRGGGSLTQDNSPLILVDGFPVKNMNDIAPSDIEDFVVLKDASSTAIYGSQGANGVILITTKTAKAGKTTVNFNTYIQQKFFPMERKLDVLSPYEYVLAQYEFAKVKGETSSEMGKYNTFYGDWDDIDIYKNIKGTDWQDEMFASSSRYSKYYNLSVSGGSDKTTFNLSFNRNEDDGLLKTSGFTRSTINFKINHQMFKNLKLDASFRYSDAIVNGAGTSGSSDLRIRDIVSARPTNGLADYFDLSAISQDPNFGTAYEDYMDDLLNPTEKLTQDYRKKQTTKYSMNIGLSWKILKNLTFRSEFGTENTDFSSYRYWGPLTSRSQNDGLNHPLGEVLLSDGNSYRLANTLTYSVRGPIHSINLIVGQELKSTSAHSTDEYMGGFDDAITPEIMFANMQKGTLLLRNTVYYEPDDKMSSFFGRAIYTYKDKYTASVVLRADGSTKFAPADSVLQKDGSMAWESSHQWGIFPSFSVAWRINKESFMKSLKFINDLKLRASYGEAGNNKMKNDLWRYVYVLKTDKSYGFGNVAAQPYYASSSTIMANPLVRWETTVTENIGLDFSLFKNRLTGTIDAFSYQTKDLLLESKVPVTTTGFKTQMQNIGQTSSTGIELTLNGILVQKKDLNITATFNIGTSKLIVDYLNGQNEWLAYSDWISASDLKSSDDYRLYVGQEIGLIYGYVNDGYYSVDDFTGYDPITRKYTLKPGVVLNDITNEIGVRPGVLKLKDLDGDGHITTADRQVIGHATPKHAGGFGLNLTYKGFDCSMFFNWKYGMDVYNTSKILFNTMYRKTDVNMVTSVDYEHRFKYIDSNGELVTDLEALRELNNNATTWSPFSNGGNNILILQDVDVEDGSFLRLNNVTVGYTLPKKITSKLYIQQLRFYATVYNVWLWTNYSGYDPDVNTNRSETSSTDNPLSTTNYNNLCPNVDYSSYPKSRMFTIGVNVTF